MGEPTGRGNSARRPRKEAVIPRPITPLAGVIPVAVAAGDSTVYAIGS